MPRKILFFIIRLLMRTLTRMEVRNAQTLPASGGAIVVINHIGRLDAAMIFLSIPREDVTGWVAEKYHESWIMRVMVKALDGIWINRFEADLKALKAAVAWLKAGKMMGIAPEGTRSLDGALMPGKAGVAYLADRTGVPLIPAGIEASPHAVREALTLRRPRISITYGEPFHLPPVPRERREEALEENTAEIMCRIAALLPPERHGVYAGHPRLQALLAEKAFGTAGGNDGQKPV